MKRIKRQLTDDLNNYHNSKRQKIQVTTDNPNCVSRETITHFEDLSNELIYEIFEFLDYLYVYQAFFSLNLRFRNLVTNLNLPIKINISSMSKSAFSRYNTDIIEPNMHRIISLRLSDVFIYDLVFSPICVLSKFNRVETLILHNIESSCLENLLDQLPSLSLLSSLVISYVDNIEHKNNIYHQIFQLPALKYCNLSFARYYDYEQLPVSTNDYSSIEHLIIHNYLSLDVLNSLLSYVPQLRRLTAHSLQGSWTSTQTNPVVLKHLTHISFKMNIMKFDQFAQLITNLFPATQVLRLIIRDFIIDPSFMDANKWKQLILSHITNLRIFDIEIDFPVGNTDDQLRIETQVNQFTSPFWVERQWFFLHQYHQTQDGNRSLFYSINPYRRKYYILCKPVHVNIYSHHHHHDESNLDSVQHVHIESEKSIIKCMKYFPNATELTFEHDFSSTTYASIATNLNRIIPLKQLTTLEIRCDYFSFEKVIELLSFTPNIHTFRFASMSFYQNDSISIKQSETFRLASSTNNITNATFIDMCTLPRIKLLVALCPRLQYLTISIFVGDLEPIIRFLLDKTNRNTRHLLSLCFSGVYNIFFLKKLETLIKSGTLLDDYTLKRVGQKLYLWW